MAQLLSTLATTPSTNPHLPSTSAWAWNLPLVVTVVVMLILVAVVYRFTSRAKPSSVVLPTAEDGPTE